MSRCALERAKVRDRRREKEKRRNQEDKVKDRIMNVCTYALRASLGTGDVLSLLLLLSISTKP